VTLAEQFGANVARCRRAAGLSQDDLAWRASMHRTQVFLAERGKTMPRLDSFVRFVGALEVDSADLLDGIEWEPGWAQAGSMKLGT
jgi:transcriptional regulator with XRE-family HTH domain